MNGFIKRNIFLFFCISMVLIFFSKVLFGLYPIPSDTIVGLYHPFRDSYAKNYPNGIPFKNFLITDPVRQIIPWKELVIDAYKELSIPLWNPYEMAGKPLIGNFQSSAFYPLNAILFIQPFYFSWSIFIISQLILASAFMYFFLRNLRLTDSASALGALAFSFSGFSVSWLEWGNVIHTSLWLPLTLLSIDKILKNKKDDKNLIIWGALLSGSLTFSFLAGHLQIFFYIFILSLLYTTFRFIETRKNIKAIFISLFLFFFLTAVQWIPTLQFIKLSARGLDQSYLSDGWFIPLKHLVQFIIPDFFGNPATLNYWGIWNYAEFSSYVGIVTATFGLFGIIFSKTKEVRFFLAIALASLVLALQNPLSELPFRFSIPFISTSQPTRLIFLIIFSFTVIAAFGFDYFTKIKNVKSRYIIPFVSVIVILLAIWVVIVSMNVFNIPAQQTSVIERNLIFPSVVIVSGFLLVLAFLLIKVSLMKNILVLMILVLVSFDLFRFSNKFSTFAKAEYLFPKTSSINFLKEDKSLYRVMATDSRILPPNFLTHYRIQTIEGYDPLYLLSYAKLIAAVERNKPDITPPYGFNRILTPRNYDSKIVDLLNVKYIFSFTDITSARFELVFEEGQTKIFRNNNVLPRAFFVKEVLVIEDENERISSMFSQDISETVVIEKEIKNLKFSIGDASVEKFEDNEIIIKTNNRGDGFLFVSEIYYPTWSVEIDGERAEIYRTNLTFRGIVVPKGIHEVRFKNHLINL